MKVNLDAMIPREDFAALREHTSSGQKIKTIGVEQLDSKSLVLKNLRKPDFQRETNHWSADQLLTFLKSYVDNELIPSVILWQSPQFMFVIDGAHRLSALRAWIADDYGDRAISLKYYGHEITKNQKNIAEKVRKRIDKEIGPYSLISEAVGISEGFTKEIMLRAAIIASRSFDVQWVEGDAAKAETSFFKINTQGTPLHKTEERLLRNREKPIAISARGIARAGTGNKYWSHFDQESQEQIETFSKHLFGLLFQPELDDPIRTLDMPLAGPTSPIESLNLLMDFIEIVCERKSDGALDEVFDHEDVNGSATIDSLKLCARVISRITGNHASSLGLHPAVYFYNSKGKHSQHLFLAVVSLITVALKNNNFQFFKKFTLARNQLEEYLIINKELISQAIVQIYSNSRIPRLTDMLNMLIDEFSKKMTVTESQLLSSLNLEGKLIVKELATKSKKFSKPTKAQILLNTSLSAAIKCPLCSGYMDSGKAVSYDHIERVEDGGLGGAENGQLTHPFCNSGMKN